MLPKPSLVLQVKLLPESYSEATSTEIKRSYIYLAQSLVTELPEDECSDGNIMRLSIRLMRPYWDPRDKESEQLWRGSFMPWLTNITRNISTAMHNFNTVLHPVGCSALHYDWADYEFGTSALLRIKVDDENRITSEAPDLIDKARALLAENVFGEDVVMIRMPSRASFEAQQEISRQPAKEVSKVVKEETCKKGDAENQESGICVSEESSAQVAPLSTQEISELEDAAEVESVSAFNIDFDIWGIEYSDGTIVEFDSRSA